MDIHFRLTEEQVEHFNENYPVYFGDDFRGSLEKWLRKNISDEFGYRIQLSPSNKYIYDVKVHTDVTSIKSPYALGSDTDFLGLIVDDSVEINVNW